LSLSRPGLDRLNQQTHDEDDEITSMTRKGAS